MRKERAETSRLLESLRNKESAQAREIRQLSQKELQLQAMIDDITGGEYVQKSYDSLVKRRNLTEESDNTDLADTRLVQTVQTQASETVDASIMERYERMSSGRASKTSIEKSERPPNTPRSKRSSEEDLKFVNQKVITNLEMAIESYKRSIVELEHRLDASETQCSSLERMLARRGDTIDTDVEFVEVQTQTDKTATWARDTTVNEMKLSLVTFGQGEPEEDLYEVVCHEVETQTELTTEEHRVVYHEVQTQTSHTIALSLDQDKLQNRSVGVKGLTDRPARGRRKDINEDRETKRPRKGPFEKVRDDSALESKKLVATRSNISDKNSEYESSNFEDSRLSNHSNVASATDGGELERIVELPGERAEMHKVEYRDRVVEKIV